MRKVEKNSQKLSSKVRGRRREQGGWIKPRGCVFADGEVSGRQTYSSDCKNKDKGNVPASC